MYAWAQQQQQRAPTLRELANRGPGGAPVQQFQSQQNGMFMPHGVPASAAPPRVTRNANAWSSAPQPPLNSDPFDAAWAAKAANVGNTNPFQRPDNVTKSFEVKL